MTSRLLLPDTAPGSVNSLCKSTDTPTLLRTILRRNPSKGSSAVLMTLSLLFQRELEPETGKRMIRVLFSLKAVASQFPSLSQPLLHTHFLSLPPWFPSEWKKASCPPLPSRTCRGPIPSTPTFPTLCPNTICCEILSPVGLGEMGGGADIYFFPPRRASRFGSHGPGLGQVFKGVSWTSVNAQRSPNSALLNT